MSKIQIRCVLDIPEYTEERVSWFADILKFTAKTIFEIPDSARSPIVLVVDKISEHENQEGVINPFNLEDRD